MPSEYIYFHQGLAYDVRSALQNVGFLQAAKNIVFKQDGKQTLRPNFVAINSTAVNAIHSIKRFRDNLIVADTTNLRWRSALAGGNFTSLGSSFRNAIWTFREYKDFLIGVNGTDSVLLDVEGNLYNTVMANPDATPVGAAGAAGNPDGVYTLYVSFLFTFPNGATYETGLSTGSADVTVSSEKISWSSIPVSTDVALSGTEPTIYRKLYRGPGTGGSLADIYYVDTIRDNTTTTYTDDSSDTTLAANDASVVDNYEPGPAFQHQEFHYGRWFGVRSTNNNRLYYSEPVSGADANENEALMPIAFEDGNWDDIRTAGYGRVDPQGLIAWGVHLFIPMKHTWIKKQGNDPSTWSYKKTWAEYGIAAPYSIDKCGRPPGILGLSGPRGKEAPGIALFNGQLSQIITSPRLDYIFEEDLNHDAIHKCRGKWDGRYYHLLYPSGGNIEPNKWLALDLTNSPDIQVAMWEDLNAQCIDVDNQTYIGCSDGYARHNAETETIDIEVETHDLVGGDPKLTNKEKTLKSLRYALNTDNEDIDLEIYIDGTRAQWPDESYTYSINGTDDNVQIIPDIPPNFKGYNFTVRLVGSGLSTFELFSPWEMEFNI